MTRQTYGSGPNKKVRFFQREWYKSFDWLSLCSTRYKVFCTTCMKAQTKTLVSLNVKSEEAFTTEGFSNWKKAIERFQQHEKSAFHREASMKIAILDSKQPDIVSKINSQKEKDQEINRKALMVLLSSIRYLARQGIPLRGHSEKDGNLHQLLRLRGTELPRIKEWLAVGYYTSHDISNEIIKLMGNYILRKLIDEVKVAGFYSLLADETRDASNKEQLVLCLRWVDEKFDIYEEPIGMFNVPETNAITIFTCIKDVLLRCALPIQMCRGQGYDGASNMQGKLNGVATKFQQLQQSALKVHCLAHCLNLVLQDVGKAVKAVRDALDLAREISRLIKFSPKHEVMFTKCRINASAHLESGEQPKVFTGIKPLCATRWTVRTGAIDAILKNYEVLQETMLDINRQQRDDNGVTAGGIAALMETFQTFWGLKVSHVVFSAAEQLSISLQGKDTTAQEAQKACQAARNYYKRLRKPEEFDILYEDAVKQASLLGIEPCLPRYRKRPRRIDDGQEPHRFTSPQDYHRQEFYETLDLVDNQLERRFEQKDFQVVCDLENVLISAANGEPLIEIPKSLHTTYSADVDIGRLQSQLKMLSDFIKAATNAPLKEVTSIRTIIDALNSSQIGKTLLSEVTKLIKIYLTIPVTTATAERSFSALRRLKTWLRSTMTQQRLNNLLMLSSHKSRCDDMNLLEIAEEFIVFNQQRQKFFGRFGKK